MILAFTSKYIPKLIIYLSEFAKEEGRSHNDLALKMGISKTNLSNVIKRLDDSEYFNVEKEGRNKYYYLSKEGTKAYKLLKNDAKYKNYYSRAKEELNSHKKRAKKSKAKE